MIFYVTKALYYLQQDFILIFTRNMRILYHYFQTKLELVK
jgi:hypothetical protein